ncbi:hypothetical protein JN00_0434 [Metamycoplasma subdolum]|uniref:Lipoprotein n=1 Tax=Metamycoplasma subdolum TaxID=92407 RepID=A0A3L9ZXZ2_9BACT|nr:hypothetical protein [Metamycoplasma subdolum]RMA77583.1 hypothetical protein JN00_0434 [Metamycoplasma subdolum]WPB50377.1 hypothetical protein R9C05_02115 [Metamycoplasma subdolum]
MKKAKFLMLLGTFSLTSLPLLSINCSGKGLPPIKTNEKNKPEMFIKRSDGIFYFKGSLSEFYAYNRDIQNPVSRKDPFYYINEYEKESDGSFKLDKNGKKIPVLDANNNPKSNSIKKPKIYKTQFADLFDFTNPYLSKEGFDYRIFTWKPQEMVQLWPSIRNSKFKNYLNRNDVLFVMYFYLDKASQQWHNHSDDWKSVLDKSASIIKSANGSENPEEAPWPYQPGILDKEKFLRTRSEPTIIFFEKP